MHEAPAPLRFGPYAFDASTGELSEDGRRIALRPQAAQILGYLLSHPGQLVTRDDLSRQLWAAETCVDSEHGLNLCIHEIRAALHDDANQPRYIETLARRGYRFIGTFAPAVSDRAESALPAGSSRSRAFSFAGGALFVVAIAAVLIVSSRSGVRDTAASPVPVPRAVASVALYPLRDVAGPPKDDPFAYGVSSELQRQLESVDSLRVTSLSSMLAYHEAGRPVAAIARELHLSHVVSGSVLRSGDHVMLNMKLTDASTRTPLWAERYVTTLADLPRVEIEAARAIAETLGVAPAARYRHPAGQAQVNAEAHAIVLKALGANTPAEYRRALEQAVTIDPNFGLAWSRLAESYIGDTWFAQTMPPADGYPKAKEYALKAVAIDESDSTAHTLIAVVKLHHEWDWAGAESELKRAIELSPSDAWAHHVYSHYLLTMDRLEESVAESRIASDLDPLNPTLSTCVGWHCLYARQYDDAIAECLKLVNDKKAGPITYYYLGRVYIRQGKFEEGIGALEIAEQKAGGINAVVATLGYAYARAGRTSDAQRVLTILEQRAKERYVSAFDIAVVHAGLGNRDAAFEWLERAFLERSTWLVHIKWDDRFAELRKDARFVALLRRMRVPDPGSVRLPETTVQARYSRAAGDRNLSR